MGTASAPRSLIRLNGHVITPKDWSVQRNAHGALDQATVVIPIQGQPDWAKVSPPNQAATVSIAGGFPSNPNPGGFQYNQLSERFSGSVDQFAVDFDQNVCTLTCRSLGAILVDTKTTTNLIKGTSQQYLTQIAKAHGMKAVTGYRGSPVDMTTVFSQDFMVGVHNMREWDLLIAAAEIDGCDVWVKGNTIYYMAEGTFPRDRIYMQWNHPTRGFIRFKGEHSPQFSKNVEVEVRSYSSTHRHAVRTKVSHRFDANGTVTGVQSKSYSNSITTANFGTPGSTTYATTYSSNGSATVTGDTYSTSSSTGGSQNSGYTTTPKDSGKEKYIFYVPNLTSAQCDARALAIWKQISQNEFVADFEFPMAADTLPLIDVTSLYNTNKMPWPSFNQDYRPRRFTEDFSVDRGWTVSVTGINHPLPQGSV